MLAVPAVRELLRFPYLASPKIDGIRASRLNRLMMSRKLEELPNLAMQRAFHDLPNYLDGELAIGDPAAHGVFHKTESAVMTYGAPATGIVYYVFDDFEHRLMSYNERRPKTLDFPNCVLLKQVPIFNLDELDEYAASQLEFGYEGIMLRDLTAPYKFGRSTLKQGWMLKIKPLKDAECHVIGFQELEHNTNPAELNALGLTKRSSHQENQVPGNTLGALIVNWGGHPLRVGIFKGFSKADLKKIWDNREKYMGQLAHIRYQAHGMKDLPRSARFIGWAHPTNM